MSLPWWLPMEPSAGGGGDGDRELRTRGQPGQDVRYGAGRQHHRHWLGAQLSAEGLPLHRDRQRTCTRPACPTPGQTDTRISRGSELVEQEARRHPGAAGDRRPGRVVGPASHDGGCRCRMGSDPKVVRRALLRVCASGGREFFGDDSRMHMRHVTVVACWGGGVIPYVPGPGRRRSPPWSWWTGRPQTASWRWWLRLGCHRWRCTTGQ